MSTLGFGDITFSSDLGRIFSLIVLLTGIVYLLVMLPFTFSMKKGHATPSQLRSLKKPYAFQRLR